MFFPYLHIFLPKQGGVNASIICVIIFLALLKAKESKGSNELDQKESLSEEQEVKGRGGDCCAVGGTHLHTFMMWEESE